MGRQLLPEALTAGLPTRARPPCRGSPASRARCPSARLGHQSHVSPAGAAPAPAQPPSSVSSSNTSARSTRPRRAGRPSVCPTRAGAQPAPGQELGSWGRRSRPRRAEELARSGRLARAPRAWLCPSGRPGAAATASTAGAGVEAGRSPQRGRGQG